MARKKKEQTSTEPLPNGTLAEGEFHPSAPDAMAYINSIPVGVLMQLQESFASTAIGGNRLSEVCLETLTRLLEQQPVSDRYLLGLAWTVRNLIDDGEREQRGKKNKPVAGK